MKLALLSNFVCSSLIVVNIDAWNLHNTQFALFVICPEPSEIVLILGF